MKSEKIKKIKSILQGDEPGCNIPIVFSDGFGTDVNGKHYATIEELRKDYPRAKIIHLVNGTHEKR